VERVFGTTIDVTERVQLEQQLQHAAKMEAIGTLAAGVAHDFNNYLMVMESTLSMLADGAVDEERDELIDAGRQALSRCTGLTRQLLAFARRQPFCPTTVDLRDVVSSFRKLLVGVVGRRADLLITLGEEAVLANVDARHIERILTNLAVNAADSIQEAGQARGVIVLTVRAVTADVPQHLVPGEVAAGRYCCLVVEDNGGGISVEQLPHIFDPYYTTKAQGRGTGLGLSSVYGMSRQNGGQVTVCPLEHGARFTVWFPRASGL
jgi:two-component system cell cycle sensor histidine kinase/response regulator CckA